MFDTVESLDIRPKLLHLFHELEQLGFFYLEARCFVRGFVYFLDIPEFLDGILIAIVCLNVMWIAEKQQILIGPAILIRLPLVLSWTSGHRCLDMT